MVMSLAALSGHAPGFDEPMEMLGACHGRIGAQCETLLRLVPHTVAYGADVPAQEAARAVLRYFNTAGVNHHLDEEQDLFPSLLAADPTDATARLLAGLCTEHAAMLDAWHNQVAPALESLCSGVTRPLDAAMVAAFVAMYRRHIAREESEMIPLARAVLLPVQLAALGHAMATRRGVANPPAK